LSACAADALPVESEFTRTEAILGVFVLELNYFDRRQLVPIAIVRVLFFGFSGAMYLS
jgi:hypothetical protein